MKKAFIILALALLASGLTWRWELASAEWSERVAEGTPVHEVVGVPGEVAPAPAPLVEPAVNPGSSPSALTVPFRRRPNLIVINLDDADRDAVEIDFRRNLSGNFYFPNIRRLVLEGQRFGNCHVAVPLCNPSRACFFTGQYAYKTGIRGNHPDSRRGSGTEGGFEPFRFTGPFGSPSAPHFQNELGVWMKAAGYRTMLVGKYLHEDYEPLPGENWTDIIPPGWDDFYASFGGSYFTTLFFKNGVFSKANTSDPQKYPSLYRTDIEATDCLDLIQTHLDRGNDQPFLLYFAPLACHQEVRTEMCLEENQANCGMVANPLKNSWSNLRQQRRPDFNEADMDDKPAPIRGLGLLSVVGTSPETNEALTTDLEFRRRLLTLKSVDLALGRFLQLLSERGMVEDTVIVLTSDNGFQLGQQRNFGKSLPYDRCSNVPLIVWGPGWFAPSPGEKSHLISNIDLAPTLLDIAGAAIPSVVQGKSFLPVLDGRYRESSQGWRPEGVLVEGWGEYQIRKFNVQANFTSVRFHQSVYTEWSTGDKEYYDLQSDPFQLQNRYLEQPEGVKFALASHLASLKFDLPTPLCFVSAPAAAGQVFFREARLEGLVESNTDIGPVKLEITEQTENGRMYWNGTSWVGQRVAVEAVVESNESVITNWHYNFRPPLNTFRNYQVRAIAANANGFESSPAVIRTFSIDADQPVSQLTYPTSEVARFGGKLVLRGWAQDDLGIRLVRLAIRNAETNQFWNGTDWQENYFLVNATCVPGVYTDWSYEFFPRKTSGSAYVTVRAISRDGRFDRPPQTSLIRWAR